MRQWLPSGFLLLALFSAALLTASRTEPFHTVQEDGPYVLYGKDQVYAHYILNDHGTKRVRTDSLPLRQAADLQLQVAGDEEGKFFPVKLQPQPEPAKTEYDGHEKMLVISDIEGNFAAFRRLLQSAGVMDNNFNWTWGKGRLVLTGDFFDRGLHVTEVLWLIYALEQKAKAAGGEVHFVLGNHEIMNMSADFRYVDPRYMEHAALLGVPYMKLFSADAELGRWLRSKNVVEKIGPYLFVHGGISTEMMNADIGLPKVNKLARPYYDDTLFQYKDPRTELIYSDLGPFWYRGYYTGKHRTSEEQLNEIMRYFKVKHIVTGHTVISDTISVLWGGKVVNTDVPHYKGHSEAFLVEGGNWFRVNGAGEKKVLRGSR